MMPVNNQLVGHSTFTTQCTSSARNQPVSEAKDEWPKDLYLALLNSASLSELLTTRFRSQPLITPLNEGKATAQEKRDFILGSIDSEISNNKLLFNSTELDPQQGVLATYCCNIISEGYQATLILKVQQDNNRELDIHDAAIIWLNAGSNSSLRLNNYRYEEYDDGADITDSQHPESPMQTQHINSEALYFKSENQSHNFYQQSVMQDNLINDHFMDHVQPIETVQPQLASEQNIFWPETLSPSLISYESHSLLAPAAEELYELLNAIVDFHTLSASDKKKVLFAHIITGLAEDKFYLKQNQQQHEIPGIAEYSSQIMFNDKHATIMLKMQLDINNKLTIDNAAILLHNPVTTTNIYPQSESHSWILLSHLIYMEQQDILIKNQQPESSSQLYYHQPALSSANRLSTTDNAIAMQYVMESDGSLRGRDEIMTTLRDHHLDANPERVQSLINQTGLSRISWQGLIEQNLRFKRKNNQT